MKIKSDKTIKIWSKPILWVYCIILCTALLASFTMGWYVGSAKVEDNRILSTVFRLDAKIQDASGAEIQLLADGDGWWAKLPAGGTYTVNVSCNKRTTGHGRCVVSINDTTYQTAVMGKCGTEGCSICAERASLPFTVTVPEGKAVEIKLMPHWGTQSAVDSTDELSANAVISLAG